MNKHQANRTQWAKLAAHLKAISKQICKDNQCTRDQHNCEYYAYTAEDGSLVDICRSDYFQGWGSADEDRHGKIAAIGLPWTGCGRDLREAVKQDCY